MDIQGGIFDFDKGQLAVGNSGTGLVRQTGGEVTGNHVVLGFLEGGIGTYETNANGILSAGESIVVGRYGTGLFRQIGGHVGAGYTVYVGLEEQGTYEIYGGRLETMELQIGHNTPAGNEGRFVQYGGDVILSGSSQYIENGLQIAYAGSSAVGSYTMHGGSLTVEQQAVIGRYGKASFIQFEGDCVYSNLLVGAWAQHYDVDYAMGNYEQSGGTCFVGKDLDVGLNGAVGRYELSGGLNQVEGDLALGRFSHGDGTYVISSGVLQINGLLINSGEGHGSFEVCGPSGSITLGCYQQGSYGKLFSEIGPGGLSSIEVATSASLSGCWTVLDNGAPLGRFDILSAGEGISGNFDSVILPGLDWSWGIENGEVLWVEHVPEPATLSLLVVGGLAMLRRRHRLLRS